MAKLKNNNNYLLQGTILAMSSIASRFIGMLYRVPLTNIIGDKGMGYYSSAYELYNLALILSSYSIPVAVSKLVSSMESKKQYRNAHNVFLTALKIAAAVGAVVAGAVYLLADAWAKLVRNTPVAIPLRVLAPTIFIFAVMGVFRGYFQGKHTMLPTALSQLVEQVVHAIVSVLAAYRLMEIHNASADMEAYGAAGGTFGAFAGSVVAFLVLLGVYGMNRNYIRRKVRKDHSGSYRETAQTAKLFGLTVLPIILSQTVYQLSGTIDNAIFGQIMFLKETNEETTSLLWGIYANKYRMLTNLPVAVATALGTSIVPALADTYTMGNDEGVRQKIASSVKFNMLIAIPSAIGLGVLAKPIVQLLFSGTEIEMSASLLSVGAVAVVLFAYSTLTNGVLQGIDQMKLPVYHAGISLGIHVVCLAIMLWGFDAGAYGLVIGNVLYALGVCVLNWRAIERCTGYRQEIRNTFLMPTLCATVMGAVAYIVYHSMYQVLQSNIVCVIVTMGVSVLCYGLLLVATRTVSEEEVRGFPKGKSLVRLLKKVRVLR